LCNNAKSPLTVW